MKFRIKTILLIAFAMFSSIASAQDNGEYAANYARAPRFNALICYEPHAEEAHVEFDKQAINFIHKLSYGEGFRYKVVTTMAGMTLDSLKQYSIIVWLNFQAGGKEREVFQQYMDSSFAYSQIYKNNPN